MLHRGVVASAKLSTQLWKRQIGVLSSEVHRDVSRVGEGACALLTCDIRATDGVKASHSLDDSWNGDR